MESPQVRSPRFLLSLWLRGPPLLPLQAHPVCPPACPPHLHPAPAHRRGNSLGQSTNSEQTPTPFPRGTEHVLPGDGLGLEGGAGTATGFPKNQNTLRVSRDTCWHFPEAARSSPSTPHPPTPLLYGRFLSASVAGQGFFYRLNCTSAPRLPFVLSIFFTITIQGKVLTYSGGYCNYFFLNLPIFSEGVHQRLFIGCWEHTE